MTNRSVNQTRQALGDHGQLLRYLHIDADTFRRVIDTLVQSELISVQQLSRGGFRYSLVG